MKNKEDVLKCIDKMIKLNKDKFANEVWISGDIFKHLNIKEYKNYKLYTSKLLPKNYMIIGRMYC